MKLSNHQSFIIGIGVGLIIALLIHGGTLDAGEIEKRRAVKAKVAEIYLNNKLELKFRYLTEHKTDALTVHYDENED